MAFGARRKAEREDLAAAQPRRSGDRQSPADQSSSPRAVSVDGRSEFDRAKALAMEIMVERLDSDPDRRLPRGELARQAKDMVAEVMERHSLSLNLLEVRDLVTALLNDFIRSSKQTTPVPEVEPAVAEDSAESADPSAQVIPTVIAEPAFVAPTAGPPETREILSVDESPGRTGATSTSLASVEEAKRRVQPVLMDRIDVTAAAKLSRADLARQIGEIAVEILNEEKVRLNLLEQRDLVTTLVNDMLGLGPLEPLLADDTITDIMVNGANQVYVERGGKLELVGVQFRNDAHVMNVATRIVSQIGRRIDESCPLVDARLADGSRVNIIIPPLAIDGPSISIRKFSKKSITLDIMSQQENMSNAMASVLKIASRCRLNILISGGTGSGKTTLLNAMSQLIDQGERIVTIEDAAELQLQQPHVVRLETRPPNLEGHGEIAMRDLLKNSLRMRPDRIILGEVRGSEALDMLQAMNTGHEGSMCTVHANRPREALTRLENMIGMGDFNLPPAAVRTQIAAAIDLIIQVSRMRDGVRRVTNLVEVVGMEGDVITTQELFHFNYEEEGVDGRLKGTFQSSGLRPNFIEKAKYYGLDGLLMEAI